MKGSKNGLLPTCADLQHDRHFGAWRAPRQQLQNDRDRRRHAQADLGGIAGEDGRNGLLHEAERGDEGVVGDRQRLHGETSGERPSCSAAAPSGAPEFFEM